MDPLFGICVYRTPRLARNLAARRRGEDRGDTVLPGLKGPPASHDLDCQKPCRTGKTARNCLPAGTGPGADGPRACRRTGMPSGDTVDLYRTRSPPPCQQGVGRFHPRPAARGLPGRPPGWATGIEPATSGTTIRRSDRLSYAHQGPRALRPDTHDRDCRPRAPETGHLCRPASAGHARGTKVQQSRSSVNRAGRKRDLAAPRLPQPRIPGLCG